MCVMNHVYYQISCFMFPYTRTVLREDRLGEVPETSKIWEARSYMIVGGVGINDKDGQVGSCQIKYSTASMGIINVGFSSWNIECQGMRTTVCSDWIPRNH